MPIDTLHWNPQHVLCGTSSVFSQNACRKECWRNNSMCLVNIFLHRTHVNSHPLVRISQANSGSGLLHQGFEHQQECSTSNLASSSFQHLSASLCAEKCQWAKVVSHGSCSAFSWSHSKRFSTSCLNLLKLRKPTKSNVWHMWNKQNLQNLCISLAKCILALWTVVLGATWPMLARF